MFIATFILGWLAKIAQSGAAIIAFFTGTFNLAIIGANADDQCAGS